MKAYKLAIYTRDTEGEGWHRSPDSYYTTKQRAEEVADLLDPEWHRTEVEVIYIEV